MSHENVEIVRRDYEAFDRGDFATLLDDVHPEEFSQVAEEFRDAEEMVLVRVLHKGRGKVSHIPAEGRSRLVHHMREGKAYQVDLFDNEAEALEAAGLSE